VTLALDRPVTHRWSSSNCWFGRPYGPPVAFVLHTESGGESGTVAEWLSSSSQLSAHYRASVTGQLDCWIDPGDRAWSNGIVEPGSRWPVIAQACGVDPRMNPNHVTVSCETEDLGDRHTPITDRQFEAVLVAAREAKNRYPESLLFLARHSDISPQSRPDCPGDRWLTSHRFEALASEVGLRIVSN
jgi:N-acetyl-anhydromuramyl-L-alanine amidase AmpD